MEESLTAHLLAFAGLTALVSTRVQWDVRPQASALPAVVLNHIDELPDYHMTGPSGTEQSRIQVDCFGSTQASALAVARQVKLRLSGLRTTTGGVVFQGGFMAGKTSGADEASGGTMIYRRSLDFVIWHSTP